MVKPAVLLGALIASWPAMGGAQQSRTVTDGVYTEAQATRGEALYNDRCASCHGEVLGGAQAPPLAGDEFVRNWHAQPLSGLVDKIKNTMPANAPGELTRQQSADVVAYILKIGQFRAGAAELTSEEGALQQITWPAGIVADRKESAAPAGQAVSGPPLGNLAQLMRGIFFPSSNLIFNVQSHDPGAQKKGPPPANPAAGSFSWVDWGAGIYAGWELVDNAAVSLADAAPLMLIPGRRCENGKPVPVDAPDWIKFTQELVDAARVAYKASQARSQEAVSDATGQLADACLHCHEAYRDKRGRNRPVNPVDPSNKAARCESNP